MSLNECESRFFEHLKADFEANYSKNTVFQAEFARQIIERYKSDQSSLTASDVYALEIIILGLEPTERLIQRAPGLRVKYRELVGDQTFAAYRPASFPDKLDDENARRPLVADLQQLLHFLHWTYLFAPVRERLRTILIKTAVRYMIGYTFIWAFFCFAFFKWLENPFLAVLVTVTYLGLIGGFISSQRRMQLIPTTGDPLASIYELQTGDYFLWFSPLTGAIFSVVLMFFFIGGVMKGGIFPEFYVPESSGAQTFIKGAWQFTYQLLPKAGKDYALLCLWSFIAGFAERFVPDAIDRLTARAQKAQETQQPVSVAATVPGTAPSTSTTAPPSLGISSSSSSTTTPSANTTPPPTTIAP